MAIALLATAFLLPNTPRPDRPTSLAAPFRALRHRSLLLVALTALPYNFGFFTLLAFTPFPLDMSARAIGLIFFGWGLLLAISSVWVAPWLQRRIGTVSSILLALASFAVILLAMAVFTDSKAVLAGGVVLAGFFLGINNTLVTETVMKAAPVERGTASAAYSFVRFGGGAAARWRRGWPACSARRSACTCRSTSGPARCCWRSRCSPPGGACCGTSTTTRNRQRMRSGRRR
jgi:MFS transporter, ACDE family, multidrug resistance protein